MDDQERPVDGENLTDDEVEDVNGGLFVPMFTLKCKNCGYLYHIEFTVTVCPNCGITLVN